MWTILVFLPQTNIQLPLLSRTIKQGLAKVCTVTRLKWIDAPIVLFNMRSTPNVTMNEILISRQMSVCLPLHDHLKHQPYSFSSDISDYVEQLNNTVTSISTGEKIIPQKEKRGGSGRLGPDTGDWSQLVISKGVRTVQGRRRSITRCDGVAD